MLTGKAKEAFIEWMHTKTNYPYTTIFNLPIVIQTAFIIEWLDNVGIWLNIRKSSINIFFSYLTTEDMYEVTVFDINGEYRFETRQEATIEGIKEANNLYNRNHEPI